MNESERAATKALTEMRERVRDDSLAISCQSLGQYRTALLAKLGGES